MAKAKRTRVNISQLELHLLCEWDDCDHLACSMPYFTHHIEKHFDSFLPEGITVANCDTMNFGAQSDKILCLWRGCCYSTCDPILLIRHLYFHGYHTKVKCRGKSIAKLESSIPECQIDGQHRNLVQELLYPFTCHWTYCEYYSQNIEAFFIHIEEHYDFIDGKSAVICMWDDCNNVYGSKHKLREHLIVHSQEKKFGCYNCGNMFSNSTKLFDHLEKQVPVDDQNFQCSHCSKIFANQRLLRDHVRIHVNHYKCPLCDMTCHSPSNLRNHINTRHSEDRPFPCAYCELGCRSHSDLIRHVQTHSPNHSFCCDFKDCHYKAKTTTSLRRHYQKVHLKMDPKRYCCHICQLRFTQGGKLTIHLKEKHKFKWPSGFSRFRYKEHEDGLYRLQTVRYESLEITEQFLNEKKQSEEAVEQLHEGKGLTEVLQEQVQRVQEDMRLRQEYEEDGRGGQEVGFDMEEDGGIVLGAEETVMHLVDDESPYQMGLHDVGMERYQ